MRDRNSVTVDRMAARRLRHVLHGLALAVGGVALGVLLHAMGWERVRATLAGVGLWFVVMAAIDLASVACDAGGVHSFLRTHAPASYGRVFVAQASGLAINRLTPGNSLGEPIKVTMLMASVPRDAAISAIVMFNAATIFVAIAAIVIGVPATVLLSELPPQAELVVWIATGVLAAFATLLAIVLRRGAIGTVLGASARLGLLSSERAARWSASLSAIDASVRQLGRPGARRGFVFCVGSRLLNWSGTLAILIAADIPLDAPLVVAVLSVGILITWISNVIPLGLGLADGGNYALYGVLGATASTGLDFTMINRMRTCVLAMMGLVVMAAASALDRRAARPSPPT